MTNPFATYAHRATSTVSPRLIGVIGTRGDARSRYAEIVADLMAVTSRLALEEYLHSIDDELLQFRAELDFYWEGDGDFAGLRKEIERAHVRLDDGLDHPRYEEKETGL